MAEDDTKPTPEERIAELEKALETATEDAEKWKAMSRKHEAQAKENAAKLIKLEAATSDQRSEGERTTQRLAELEKQNAAIEVRAMRAEVAAAKGLTSAQAKRITGSTVEEMESDADDLLESFKPAPDTDGASDTGGKPREKLRGGASDEDAAPEQSIEEVLKAVPR
jgi:hypothetical protein